METRNILDYLGNTIGTLQYPNGTAESIWTAELALYSQASPQGVSPAKQIEPYVITATGNVTTSSSTAATITSMTYKPSAGQYIVEFYGSAFNSGISAQGEFGLYVDGVLVTETRRDIACAIILLGGLVSVSLNTIGAGMSTSALITVDGSQTIDVRFKSNNLGTIGFSDRVFKFLRVK